MKPRRGNFTRGSQLIETFSMLFAAGLKPMLWVLATLFSVSLAYLMWSNVQTDDYYRAIMRAYRRIFGPDWRVSARGGRAADRLDGAQGQGAGIQDRRRAR
jgi:hypothetical protein